MGEGITVLLSMVSLHMNNVVILTGNIKNSLLLQNIEFMLSDL